MGLYPYILRRVGNSSPGTTIQEESLLRAVLQYDVVLVEALAELGADPNKLEHTTTTANVTQTTWGIIIGSLRVVLHQDPPVGILSRPEIIDIIKILLRYHRGGRIILSDNQNERWDEAQVRNHLESNRTSSNPIPKQALLDALPPGKANRKSLLKFRLFRSKKGAFCGSAFDVD
jgi:hypothetical protein